MEITFSQIHHHFQKMKFLVMSLCIIVIIWQVLHTESLSKCRQLKCSYYTRTPVCWWVLTTETDKYSDRSILKWHLKYATKDRSSFLPFFLSFFLFLSLNEKKSTEILCWNNCFHFVKTDNNNNKSDINIKMSQLRNNGKFEKNFIFILSQMISQTISLSTSVQLCSILYIIQKSVHSSTRFLLSYTELMTLFIYYDTVIIQLSYWPMF
jgi:hypothetical protein